MVDFALTGYTLWTASVVIEKNFGEGLVRAKNA